MKNKNKINEHNIRIHKPKSIKEAVSDLEEFFECDMWYSAHNEWKTEEDMIRYLRTHFSILDKQIKLLRRKK